MTTSTTTADARGILTKFPVTERDTFLNGLVLFEKINFLTLDRILHSDNLTKDSEYMLENYIKNKREEGIVSVKYVRSKKGPNLGRVNPSKSLGFHSMKRAIRHTLAYDNYVDIDIENAHPVILLQILESNGYKGPTTLLRKYINERDAYLAKIIDIFNITTDARQTAKGLVQRLLYGGCIDSWKKEHNLEGEIGAEFKKIQQELEQVHDFIASEHRDLLRKIQIIKNYNAKGSLTSYILQEYENQILEVVYGYCLENEYIENNVCSLCNDGIMLEERLYKPQLLDELADEVHNKTGLKVRFVNKELSESFHDSIIDRIRYKYLLMRPTDGDISEIFRLLFGHLFLCKRDELYFYNGVKWVQKSNAHAVISEYINSDLHKWLSKKIIAKRKQIEGYITKFRQLEGEAHKAKGDDKIEKEKILENYKKEMLRFKCENPYHLNKKEADKLMGDEDHPWNNLLAMLTACSNIGRQLDTYLKNVKSREGLIKDIRRKILKNEIEFDRIPHLVGFNNGVYDLFKNEFVDSKPEYYISKTTGWSWQTYKCAKKRSVIAKFLESIFPDIETRAFALMELASFFYGVSPQKIFIHTGVGSNGKSVLTALLHAACGDYFKKLPTNILTKPLKDDECNPALAILDGARGCSGSEPGRGQKMQASPIKRLTGGGTILTRGIYQGLFTLHLIQTLMIEANQIPPMDECDYAIKRRIRCIPFVSKFLPQTEYDELSKEEKRDGRHFLADDYVDSDDFRTKYRQVFTEIIFDAFQMLRENKYEFNMPPEVEAITKSYLRSGDELLDWLNCSYSKHEGGVISIGQFYKDYKESSIYMNMSKSERRTITKEAFEEMIRKNVNLKELCLNRNQRYKGTKLSSFSLVGIKKRDPYSKEPLLFEDHEPEGYESDDIEIEE